MDQEGYVAVSHHEEPIAKMVKNDLYDRKYVKYRGEVLWLIRGFSSDAILVEDGGNTIISHDLKNNINGRWSKV